MYEWNIRDAKSLPDYTRSDPYEVWLSLDGQAKDEKFVKFLEQISAETHMFFSTEDLLTLAAIHDTGKSDPRFSECVKALQNAGAIERYGRKLVLARRFYQMAGRKGEYTRKRGLDRETNKALLLKHIEDNRATGSTANEFRQVLPDLTRHQITSLLKEIKNEGKIHNRGTTRAARWYPGSSDTTI